MNLRKERDHWKDLYFLLDRDSSSRGQTSRRSKPKNWTKGLMALSKSIFLVEYFTIFLIWIAQQQNIIISQNAFKQNRILLRHCLTCQHLMFQLVMISSISNFKQSNSTAQWIYHKIKTRPSKQPTYTQQDINILSRFNPHNNNTLSNQLLRNNYH